MLQLADRRSVLVLVLALSGTVVLVAALATYTAARKAPTPALETVDVASETLPVGSALPSPEYCATYANQVGSGREAVLDNGGANHSVPTGLKLPPWPDYWNPLVNRLFVPRIDGQYTGTTDQILMWGACKWGISPDLVRAMAMAESSWRQSKVGDYEDDQALCVSGDSAPCPTSFGILQIKHIFRPGSWPDSQRHTAFNVDYSLAVLRGCFEGWILYLENGYTAGDIWGCVGWHYSGNWKDNPAFEYVHGVEDELDARYWVNW